MFARSPSRELRAAELPAATTATAPPPLAAVAGTGGQAGDGAAAQRPRAALHALSVAGPLDRAPVSIIGRDLAISGSGLRIVSRGILQVDGVVEGDVEGAEIVIGEDGRVTGLVTGDKVVVRGHVEGTIRGVQVTLAARAHVEGEIQHQTLAIEQGAMFEGKARRSADIGALRQAQAAGPRDAGKQ